jgi:tetratricopeptide (TPR) repeat protein
VNTYEQRSARAALDAARPAVARLDSSRGPEDLAADLIETWGAIEAALRTLVGSTVLTGQPLIREARQRQVINFDQANTLAEFQAVHDRLQDTSYRASDADVNSARSAFLKLDTVLMGEVAPAARPAPRDVPPAAVDTTAPLEVSAPPGRSMPSWAILGAATVVLILLIGGGYLIFGRRGPDSLQQGIEAYQHGQREVAVSAFGRAARENPKSALPHVYLARMAREVGNFTLASQELQLALQAEPNNAVALREMGANLLTQGNYELARRFYVRAVQADPTDKSAQGYLACTLMRLGRTTEATNFLNRAGPGVWSNCTPASTPTTQAAGSLPPIP